MRTRNRAVVAAMCAGLAATLAACGGGEKDPDAGTNGVGKLPAAKIESKARKAAEDADSVRLSGSLVTKGVTYKLNMRLKSDGGTGQVSTKGSTFELLRVDKELYLKADADFWSHDGEDAGDSGSGDSGAGTDDAADKLDNKYVKVPSDDPSYQRLSGFTDMSLLLDGLLGLQGEIATGDHGQVGGVRTIRISAGEDGAGGSLDVSLEGRPYPLQLRRAGGAGVIRLADWNKDFQLTAPAKGHVLDYGQQLPGTP